MQGSYAVDGTLLLLGVLLAVVMRVEVGRGWAGWSAACALVLVGVVLVIRKGRRDGESESESAR